MKRVYVSGPMTGMPDFNYPAFNAAAAQLRAAGYEVVNPAELDANDTGPMTWEQYMRRDIKALMDCDGLALLPGWRNSRGALLESFLARALGFDVRPLNGWLAGVERVSA